MKALALTAYNKPFEWLESPIPEPDTHQITVEIKAVGINPLDNMIQQGQFKQLFPYKLPMIMGNEFSGIITKVGSGVSNWKVGDEVFARPDILTLGAFAEFVNVDVADIAPKPSQLSWEQAASIPLVLLTAIQAFTEKTQISAGSKVFIQGGAGGLGSIAVQVAKYLGATVATTVSTKDVELAHDLGADIVVDYRTQRYEDYVQDFDVVLDTLGGEETLRAMHTLKAGGTLLSVVAAPDAEFAAQLGKPLLKPVMSFLSRKQRKAAKQHNVTYKFLFMHASGHQLEQFTPALNDGSIRPVVGEIFAFDDLPQAIAQLSAKRSSSGKIVAVRQ
ncbi:NADP-dependent oxidoreductase [Corynebacterium sp. sy039]|uniref:NADP-dependent oxidoreductase n=1 Tax=Corynebacterium sp. sy039 TaxID=2599641 RepID=UPI0011B41B32|nr:NADP-dependent oxidoreductase [Corynebacterium sp. sy039]QDZ41837.1 NADP-dependent oxidoreductase [Corynebacterium sp. sy039]